ncbi:ABC transporter substrate-binding protein [Neptuniibacter sp.]|uniref:substrate-binding periplasmic protein n=1 Tax=Neptuniibacter sp. TaxID=1962643 RepID=UPI002639BBEA|nr:transporter substrate-binding domain-containing protein [Neptuniibacter sp.]MCP4596464.1 amino acid ABC transporter substrate-binding protein [Neptuniibacter sp.]
MSLLIIPLYRSFLCFLLAVLLLVGPMAHATDDEVVIYSEHYPPFNFYRNNKPQGISVELLKIMFEQMSSPLGVEDIQFGPWPRGYKRALTQKNSMLFSTHRTQARERLFKWVGPIISSRNGLIVRSYLEQDYSDYRRMKGLRVGVIKNDIAAILLEELNIPDIKIIHLVNPEKAAMMLENGSLDIWAYDVNVAADIQRRLGLLPAEYTVALYLGQPGLLYFAFNLQTEDRIVENYQQALNRAKQATNSANENRFAKILEHFNYSQLDEEMHPVE